MAKAILMVFQTGIRIPLETKGETIHMQKYCQMFFFFNTTAALWKVDPSGHEMKYLAEEIFKHIFEGEF